MQLQAVFVDKLERIHQSIATSLLQFTESNYCGRQHTGRTLSQLLATTADEVRKILTTTCLKPSPTDVLPATLLRSAANICEVEVAGSRLKVVPKSLGVTIDSRLQFDCYAKEVAIECVQLGPTMHAPCVTCALC